MKITILGCGGSNGVPEIGCRCSVCMSNDPKNNRSRASILIQHNDNNILIDTSTDFRQQALNSNITILDAVIFTHEHMDHVAGIDDIKLFCKYKSLPCYTDKRVYDSFIKNIGYIFTDNTYYNKRLEYKEITPYESFKINDSEIVAFNQVHGKINSLGFRINNFTYSTDVNNFSQRSLSLIKGTRYWIIDCMRYYWAPSHSYLEKTLDWIEFIKPEYAILTHMSHHIDYNEIISLLPKHVVPAYDGMQILI